MVDDNAVDTNDNPEGDTFQPTPEEYKNLQRSLEKTRQGRKRDMQDVLKASVVEAKLDGMTAMVRDLTTAVRDGADEDGLNKILADHEAVSRAVTTQAQYSERVQDMLRDSEYEWEDDENAPARAAWESGDLDKAVREVEKIARPTAGSAEEIIQLVDSGIQKALARMGMGVDEGSQSAPAKQEVRIPVEDLISDPSKGAEYLTAFYAKVKPRS